MSEIETENFKTTGLFTVRSWGAMTVIRLGSAGADLTWYSCGMCAVIRLGSAGADLTWYSCGVCAVIRLGSAGAGLTWYSGGSATAGGSWPGLIRGLECSESKRSPPNPQAFEGPRAFGLRFAHAALDASRDAATAAAYWGLSFP